MRRSLVVTALHLVPLLTFALPVPRREMLLDGKTPGVRVLEYNEDAAYSKFELAPGIKDEELTSPLVLELQVHPSPNLTTSDVSLNYQHLDISWTLDEYTKSFVAAPRQQTLSAPDRLGVSHILVVTLSGTFSNTLVPGGNDDHVTQNIDIRIDSIDGIATGLSFRIQTQPTNKHRLLSLTPVHVPKFVEFKQYEGSYMLEKQETHVTPSEPVGYDEDAHDIETELESLLLLEAEASDLQTTIAAKKHAIAKCLRDHREHVTLRHLLSQCDGVVCAAKVIAQRLCDKMGIETLPNVRYVQMEDSNTQQLIHIDNAADGTSKTTSRPDMSEKQGAPEGPTHTSSIISATSLESNRTFRGSAIPSTAAQPLRTPSNPFPYAPGTPKWAPTGGTANTTNVHPAAIQDVRLVHPQNVLFRVLGVIASVLGLTALFGFIRRKCMSPRSLVDRAAAKEERLNARAYRRAARRAEMRRRCGALIAALNCFRPAPERRVDDYEEKRALILQDAFLEQDADMAEKGEVMEAEIRELRNAQQIVLDLVRGHEQRRGGLPAAVNDPPPPLVALPYTPTARSRASTQTLPSYCSEILPDYTSRYARTEGTVSSSSSLRSRSVVTDGFSLTSPTATSETGGFTGGSTSRSHSPESSHTSHSRASRMSRYTAASSIIDTSSRPSQDTLRTMC